MPYLRFMLLCCFLFSSLAHAAPTPISAVESDTTVQAPPPSLSLSLAGEYRLGWYGDWLEDSGRALSAEQALMSGAWQSSSEEDLNFGFSHSAYWVKTIVTSQTLSEWALWIQYSLLDRVELWVCPLPNESMANCQYQQAGDQLPFDSNRSYQHPNTIFPLTLAPQTSYLLLLKVDTQGTYRLPMVMIDQDSLRDALFSQNIWRGAFYGILLIMGLYNLFIFFPTRSRSYLFYAGFVLSFLVFHMVYEGSAFQLLWPNIPIFNNYALPFFFALSMLMQSLFVPSFLNLRENQSHIFTLFRAYSALILVSLLMLPLINYQHLVPTYYVFNFILTVSALLAGAYHWHKGNRSAGYFTLAWAAFILGLVLEDARSIGWLAENNMSLYAYQVGAFLEISLLSLALARRIIQLQQEQLDARQTLLKSQEQAIGYLRDYEDLYQNSLTGKFQLDNEGYFIKSNASWRTILGYSNETYFSDDNPRFNDLFTDHKQRRKFWRKLREQSLLKAQVVSFIQPISGEKVMVSITVRKGTNGQAAWYGSGQDVTENYLREQALLQLQQEKAQSLRQLVIGVAEEMASPLGQIRTAEKYFDSSLLLDSGEQKQQVTQGLTMVQQGLGRIVELNELMKASIIEEKQYANESINIRHWFETWCDGKLAQDELLKLRVQIHSYLVDWLTYPDALALVLDQLLDNSCTHNAEKHQAGDLKILVELRERGEFLELHYHDNGKGVSQDKHHTIFMPFYTTQGISARNNGLGLYQTYNLLTELMQGFIEWPEEAEGFYIVVRFNLPLPAPAE